MSRSVFVHDNPDRFVAGTVGEPGQRTFYLQARSGRQVNSVALEKSQVEALAERIGDLLDEVERMTEGRIATGVGGQAEDRAPLEMPIDEEFRVASLSLGWDEDAERVLIEASGPGDQSDGIDSDDSDDGVDDSWLGTHDGDDGPDTLRVQLTPQQARAFSIRAAAVVSAGRPACPFCSLPLDPDGHVCPRANGYRR